MGKVRGWDPAFFFCIKGVSNARLASYAASAGNGFGVDENTLEKIYDSLRKIGSISVRDSKTQKLVEKATGRSVPEVLDPTLLIDVDVMWARPRLDFNTYVLIYGKLTKQESAVIREWADRKKLLVVSVGHRLACADYVDLTAGPNEWVNWIDGAEVVISKYFHGLLVSLKRKKTVVQLLSRGKQEKICDVSIKLGIEREVRKELKKLSDFDQKMICGRKVMASEEFLYWQAISWEFLGTVCGEARESNSNHYKMVS